MLFFFYSLFATLLINIYLFTTTLPEIYVLNSTTTALLEAEVILAGIICSLCELYTCTTGKSSERLCVIVKGPLPVIVCL